MPDRIPRPCKQAGCPKTTTDGYCLQHQHQKRKKHRRPENRPNSYRRGYGYAWHKARRLFLRDEPLCRVCAGRGLIVAASVVDHITPHEGDPMRFWDRDNWQPLCKRCHDRKTGTEQHNAWY